MNHYEALGVEPSSDAASIRRAYLAAARLHHPDYHVDSDAEARAGHARMMQQVNQAWEVLGDPVARAGYDRALLAGEDPGVRRRAQREPDAPAGKGWTPRPGDDGWMDDFAAWADERDELAPDEPRSAGRNLATVAPVGLLGAAGFVGFLGLLLGMPGLVAIAGICVIFSIGLFIMLPMFEMSRGRGR